MRSGVRLVVCMALLAAALLAAPQFEGRDRLEQARRLLTGDHKNSDDAKKILLSILQTRSADSPQTLIWTEIYLGYIEDRADHRDLAIAWYRQALKVKGAAASGLDMAKYGIEQPLIWIKHLDEGTSQPKFKDPGTATSHPPAVRPAGKAYVTGDPPVGLAVARNLSAAERRSNFEALWSLIDENYAHFKLKSIDWPAVGQRYRARLDSVSSDDDFYFLLYQLVNELRDTHSWLDNFKRPEAAGVTDMPVDIFQNKPFVVAGPKAGWEVISVDGKTADETIESLRPTLRAFSSERAFRREAVRSLFAGEADSKLNVVLRSPGGETETLAVTRGRRTRPRPAPLATFMTRQRYVHYGRLPSGLGYIRIDSFLGREDITAEFDRALDALRDTPALVLDIRNNAGGFGHDKIAGRFFQKRTLAAYAFIKKGPKHDAFDKREIYLEPAGPWQYTRPVALLVNDVTGSASDLFTTLLRASRNVTTIGTTTHGNLSGVATYAVLPCGLVVRISNGYIADANNRPIEVNGNVPDIAVETTIQDYLAGKDPVLDRAVEFLTRPPTKSGK